MSILKRPDGADGVRQGRQEQQERAREAADATARRRSETMLPPNRLAAESELARRSVSAEQREQANRAAIAAQTERARVQRDDIGQFQRFRASIHESIATAEADRRSALEQCDLEGALVAETRVVAARSLLPRLDEVLRLRYPPSFPLIVA